MLCFLAFGQNGTNGSLQTGNTWLQFQINYLSFSIIKKTPYFPKCGNSSLVYRYCLTWEEKNIDFNHMVSFQPLFSMKFCIQWYIIWLRLKKFNFHTVGIGHQEPGVRRGDQISIFWAETWQAWFLQYFYIK